MTFYKIIASQTGGSDDLMTALGIDWRLLILQIVAFLILVAILGKYVYPWLIRSIDERQRDIQDAKKANLEAQKLLDSSQLDMQNLLDEAKQEAAEIIETAKQEAADTVSRGEQKARAMAERITAEAEASVQRDIESARRQLRAETAELVALATQKVIGKVYTSDIDKQVIEDALEEAK